MVIPFVSIQELSGLFTKVTVSRTFKLENVRFGQREYTVACAFECSGVADLTVEGVYFSEHPEKLNAEKKERN